jgi:hypothetical protein
MPGNDIDHLQQQRAKLHHIRRFLAIVASPPPQVVVEKSIAAQTSRQGLSLALSSAALLHT